jgi:GTP-binding protein
VPADELQKKRQKLKRASKRPVLLLSGATGQGVGEAMAALYAVISEARAKAAAEKEPAETVSP